MVTSPKHSPLRSKRLSRPFDILSSAYNNTKRPLLICGIFKWVFIHLCELLVNHTCLHRELVDLPQSYIYTKSTRSWDKACSSRSNIYTTSYLWFFVEVFLSVFMSALSLAKSADLPGRFYSSAAILSTAFVRPWLSLDVCPNLIIYTPNALAHFICGYDHPSAQYMFASPMSDSGRGYTSALHCLQLISRQFHSCTQTYNTRYPCFTCTHHSSHLTTFCFEVLMIVNNFQSL